VIRAAVKLVTATYLENLLSVEESSAEGVVKGKYDEVYCVLGTQKIGSELSKEVQPAIYAVKLRGAIKRADLKDLDVPSAKG